MNKLSLTALLLLPSISYAGYSKGTVKSVYKYFRYVPEDKLEAFMAKRGPCVFYANQVVNFSIEDTRYSIPNSTQETVACIWDGVYQGGTINEVKGCFAGPYSTIDDDYKFYDPIEKAMLPGPCTPEKAIALIVQSQKTVAGYLDHANIRSASVNFGTWHFGGTGDVKAFVKLIKSNICNSKARNAKRHIKALNCL